MIDPRGGFAGLGLALTVVLAACSGPPGASPALDRAAAERYCTDQGGMLVDRTATWNTNADPSQWLQLAGRERFCEFEMGQGDEATGSPSTS